MINLIIDNFELIIVFISVVADSWSEGQLRRKNGWWEYHILKWIAYYILVIPIMLNYLCNHLWSKPRLLIVVIFTAICWIVWKIIYKWSREYYNKKG
jgi:uncharacterized BrkB/YihY/UPF0761 family membrane protein